MLGQAVTPPVRWSAPEGAWTEPDLHLFPQDGHRYEIVDGCLHVTPPAPKWHDTLVGAVVTTLRAAAPPGWWVVDRLGIAINEGTSGVSNLVPDVTVLRPRSSGSVWSDPADVALVVEIETATTRRYDTVLKPSIYAEAGIRDLWRVSRGAVTPLLRTFQLVGGAFEQRHSIEGAEPVKLDAPFPLRIAPAAWV